MVIQNNFKIVWNHSITRLKFFVQSSKIISFLSRRWFAEFEQINHSASEKESKQWSSREYWINTNKLFSIFNETRISHAIQKRIFGNFN